MTKNHIISVVNDFQLYNKYIKDNIFTKDYNLYPLDNTINNESISKLYNTFLNNYDYSKESWFIFCHPDFELLENIDTKLDRLNKNNLYGPIGCYTIKYNNKVMRQSYGLCYEEQRNGKNRRSVGVKISEPKLVETFDCQCIIIHSSLVNKFHLRFDEKLSWHLYVEDFCINSKLNYNINSYAININCCHHSDTGYSKSIPKEYTNSLNYLNLKYPDALFSAIMSYIGGKKFTEFDTITKIKYLIDIKNGKPL